MRACTKNTISPMIITSNPHQMAFPVCEKSHSQPTMVNSAGSGYNHILKGSRSGGQRRRSSMTPTAWPMNWMIRRIARTAVITVFSLKSKLKTNVSAPRNNSEMCGNFSLGCTREKTRKKFPSNAAEYGTREYPSIEEKSDANAIHRIISVANHAAEVADVVVAPVGVNRVDRGRAQPGKE